MSDSTPSAVGAEIAKLKKSVQVGAIRWRDLALGRALRVALGVMAPLAIGFAVGHLQLGAFAALGAVAGGFASLQGETRTRFNAILIASFGMAACTFVGATSAAMLPWLTVPLVVLMSYVAGLAVSLGPRLAAVALQISIALVAAIALPMAPSEAAVRAVLVCSGGLLQAALVAASWTLNTGARERAVLAETYRGLAEYASIVAAGKSDPPQPIAFPADALLTDPNPLLTSNTRLLFVDLLEEAERLRASLAALAGEAEEMHPDEAKSARSMAGDVAGVLRQAATALESGRRERPARIAELLKATAALGAPEIAPWRWAGEAVLGQLRAVGRLAARLDALPTKASEEATPLVRERVESSSVPEKLWANVTISSEAGRHGLRLAAAAGLAEFVIHWFGLANGHWVLITLFMVLKPDYNSTLLRSFERALGTALGAALGALLAYYGHLGPGALMATMAASIATAMALYHASYLLFSLFLTLFVVLLLNSLGISAVQMAETRFVDTAVGSLLAFAAYLVWPTWEGKTAQEKFARMLEAHGVYAKALLVHLAEPDPAASPKLREYQLAARRARSDADASASRLSSEPGRGHLTPEVAGPIMAATARLALAELTLHAMVSARLRSGDKSSAGVCEQLLQFAEALGETMARQAAALAALEAPEPAAPLRPLQAAIQGKCGEREAAVADMTDRLVDAVNTLDSILRTKLGTNLGR